MKIETKSQPISYYQVGKAYKSAKKGGKAVGVDGESMLQFEERINDNLYKLWNRMTSGSYTPPAVRRHEIPKEDGSKRLLGIPTVSDRIAQKVAKDYMEPKLEWIFHASSFGYRPGKDAHQAIRQCIDNCRKYDWVIDLDIRRFFDNLDHELLMRALKVHFKEKWVQMYVERWLQAPIEDLEGKQKPNEKGTPQGGVISPLLSNLFLHYALDQWLEKYYPAIKFERYADDMVIHCVSYEQAEQLLTKIKERLETLKLEVHPIKTKIVYCKRGKSKINYPVVSFDFLGHQFKPIKSMTKSGRKFLSYGCQISQSSSKKIVRVLKEMAIHKKTGHTIRELADLLNPKVRGWINYYSRYGGGKFKYLLHLLNIRLCKWVKWRYKLRFRTGKMISKMLAFYKETPGMFVHWSLVKPLRAK
jgi:RNA-directed DNA polymerase